MLRLAGFIAVVVCTVLVVSGQQTKIVVNPTLPTTIKSSRKITPPPVGKNSSICYKYVGCFSTYPPFDNTGGVLPNPPSKVGTVFLLYTQHSRTVGQQLDYKDKGVSLTKTDFNSLYPTKFVIHGFTQDEKELWVHQMKDALLTTGPLNVVIVGWGLGAAAPDYPKAVANTRLVAKQIELLIRLMQAKGMDISRVHLIGHSLGAHISGYVGDAFKGLIGRISGMDPAGPFYEGSDEKVRLNPSDAKFVDVVHSNGKPVWSAGAGLFATSGHVDFYPNGGKTQPGCPPVFSTVLGDIFGFNLEGAGETISCSHGRSHELYIESIANGNHCGLVANPCATLDDYQKGKCATCGDHGCSELGYHSIEYAARGTFYLLTKGFKTASAPKGEQFCGSTYEISISSSTGPQDIKGSIRVKIEGTKSSTETSFQGKDDTLGPDAKIVIVDYEPFGDLKSVTITYTHSGGFLGWFGSGTEQWYLDRIVVADDNKQFKFCNSKPTKIMSGKSVKIPLCS